MTGAQRSAFWSNSKSWFNHFQKTGPCKAKH